MHAQPQIVCFLRDIIKRKKSRHEIAGFSFLNV